jgi:hypothetical protein
MKKTIGFRLVPAIAALLAGCAGMTGEVSSVAAATGPAGIINRIDERRYFVAQPDKERPCSAPNVYYFDEVKGARQIVVDWDAVRAYTLQGNGRERLIRDIKNARSGCPQPYLIESQNNSYYNGKATMNESRGFVLFWLDGGVIHLKAVQFQSDPDEDTGLKLSSPMKFEFRNWSDLKPNADRRAPEKGKPYRGPVAVPQIVYRIDEDRYFEFVPRQAYSCMTGTMEYVDRNQGIRSEVEYWDGYGYDVRSSHIIDAADTRYLLAPWRNELWGVSGNGGGARSSLAYSADSGRTWHSRQPAKWGGDEVYAIGEKVYMVLDMVLDDGDAWVTDLSKPEIPGWDWDKNWAKFKKSERPLPQIARKPLDSKFHCTTNGEERLG